MALSSTDPYDSPQEGSTGTNTPIQGLRRRRRGLTSPQVKSPMFYTAYTPREYRDMLRDSPNSLSPRAFELDPISSVSPHHRGPHRDGFTEEKCRSVLVRECSIIPRMYCYRDGIQLVYEILRNHLGDENLDLAIGVLYEFIELPADHSWEEGAAFKTWAYDHSMRKFDFTNAHVPRLGNVIVGPIQPTQALQKHREEVRRREVENMNLSGPRLSMTAAFTPGNIASGGSGIRNRHSWQINHSVYVSNISSGTQVLYCPTPRRLNEMSFDQDFGRGGRLVEERYFSFGRLSFIRSSPPVRNSASTDEQMLEDKEETASIKNKKKKKKKKKRGVSISLPLCGITRFLKPKKNSSPRTSCPCDLGGQRTAEIKEFDTSDEMKTLPDTSSLEGKRYYANIPTIALPDNVALPAAFFRKHGLIAEHESLPEDIQLINAPCAEDKAIENAHLTSRIIHGSTVSEHVDQNSHDAHDRPSEGVFNGPFTAALFKDGGLDFHWDNGQHQSPSVSGMTTRGSIHSLSPIRAHSHGSLMLAQQSMAGDDPFWSPSSANHFEDRPSIIYPLLGSGVYQNAPRSEPEADHIFPDDSKSHDSQPRPVSDLIIFGDSPAAAARQSCSLPDFIKFGDSLRANSKPPENAFSNHS